MKPLLGRDADPPAVGGSGWAGAAFELVLAFRPLRLVLQQ